MEELRTMKEQLLDPLGRIIFDYFDFCIEFSILNRKARRISCLCCLVKYTKVVHNSFELVAEWAYLVLVDHDILRLQMVRTPSTRPFRVISDYGLCLRCARRAKRHPCPLRCSCYMVMDVVDGYR